ncbi:hypothetical protein BD779DRAFT_1671556 [Infundibulicybe gibba]|nr:hypothetical protein BD779DRAFT_1671556 [Infundibulicybe gibba]
MTFEPLRTSVLASFPWSTDTVVMKSDLAMGFDPGDSPKGLIQASETLERKIPTTLAENLRQIHDESPAEFRLFTDNWTKHKGVVKMLVCLLTTYRVIDVRSWIGDNSSENVPLFPRLAEIGSTKEQPWSEIRDWMVVLREARTSLGRVEVENSPRPFNFAHSICRLVRDKNRAQAFLNFQVAAMHLNYISEGNTDLPDQTEDLFEQLAMRSTTTSKSGDKSEDYSLGIVLNEMSKTTQRLRLLLHIALFVSPLFLLAPKSFHERDWDRKSLIMTFRAFGNGKPEWLKYVEKLLWNVLFQMAGGANVVTAIQAFLGNLPWDMIDGLPVAEKQWFQTTKEFDIWDSPGVSEIRVKGDLPVDWPVVGTVESSLKQGDLLVDWAMIGAVGSSLKRKDHGGGTSPHAAKRICLSNPDIAQANREEEEEEEEDDDNSNMDMDPDVGVNTQMFEESREEAQGGNAEGDGAGQAPKRHEGEDRGGGNGERDGGDKAEENTGKSEVEGVEKGGGVDEDREEEEDDGSKEGSHGNGNDKRREESSDEEESDPGQNGEKEISTDEDQQFKGTSAVRHSRKSAGTAARNSAARKATAPISHKPKHPSARKSAPSESSGEEEDKKREEDSDEGEDSGDKIPIDGDQEFEGTSAVRPSRKSSRKYTLSETTDEDQESEGTSPMQSSPKSAHRYTRLEISEEEGSHSSENGENEVSTDEDRHFKGTSAARHPRKSTGVATQNSAAHKPATLIAQKPKHQSARKSARLDGPACPSSPASKALIRRKDNKRNLSRAARPPARTSLADGDSIFQPIDLTKLDDPTLDHLATPEKHVGPAYRVFGPQGEQFEIKPTSHDELKKLLCILNAVTNKYVGGQPLHISQPKDSTFAIFSEEEFDRYMIKLFSTPCAREYRGHW